MSKADVLLESESTWILEQGDKLEIYFKNNLRQHIPYYEVLWGTFIGNDTHNHIVNMPGLPENIIPIRKRFSECHYTIAESILCMEQCINDIAQIETKIDGENILRFQTFFVAFFAHVGRANDNISNCIWDIGLITEKIKGEPMTTKGEFDKHEYSNYHMNELKSFYSQRHVVVHGKKVPLSTNKEGIIFMPRIRDDKQEQAGWHQTLSWSDFTDPVELVEQLKSVFFDFCKIINNILASLHNDLTEYLKMIKVSINTPKQVYDEIHENLKKKSHPTKNNDNPEIKMPYSGSHNNSPLSDIEKQILKGGISGWDGSSGSAGK